MSKHWPSVPTRSDSCGCGFILETNEQVIYCPEHVNRLRSKMKGIITRVVADKGYGFITAGSQDYFFHRSDYKDGWNGMEAGIINGQVFNVEFEPENTGKGLRARNVMLV